MSAETQREDILLGVLTAIDRDSNTSQRTISRELNVALGLANAYMKRCVRKGLIKIKQVPRRRYAYYLTPKGFAEKTRLAGEYFSASFNFFRRAREEMSELLSYCAERGWKRILFAGVSELAEVGTLCAYDHPVGLVGILDPSQAGKQFAGLSVKRTVEEFEPVDAVIVTQLTNANEVYEAMQKKFGAERVMAPKLLRHALSSRSIPRKQGRNGK